MDQEIDKETCEDNGGTWTQMDGTWKCVHPEDSMESSDDSDDDDSEM